MSVPKVHIPLAILKSLMRVCRVRSLSLQGGFIGSGATVNSLALMHSVVVSVAAGASFGTLVL